MRRTDRRASRSIRRATDELLLARLLGVEQAPTAPGDALADEQLLSELLLAPEALAASRRLSLRKLLLAFAAMLALFSCVPLASAAQSLLAIRNNVAAMRQTTVEGQTSTVEGQTSKLEGQTGEPGNAPQLLAKSAGGQVAPQPDAAQPVADVAEPSTAERNTAESSTFERGSPALTPAAKAGAPAASPAAQPIALTGSTPFDADRGRPSTVDLRPSTPPPTATAEPVAQAINVLLLGIDRRPGQTGPARADSVIVARIDPQAGRVALVSFPRDLQVEIPGVGWDRINAMTVYGEMYPELGGSLDLSRRTVATLLGIPIDHAVSVDFGGFISAVDALGGITVDVEREVYDSYTENHFAAGPQHMDGRTALWYSRIRFLDSDFERMRRQQSVLLGLMSRIREQNALERLRSLASVTGALRGYIQTDLPEDRMVRLAWGLRNFSPEAVEQYRLEVDQVDIFVNPADPYAQYIRPGAVEDLVHKLMGK